MFMNTKKTIVTVKKKAIFSENFKFQEKITA